MNKFDEFFKNKVEKTDYCWNWTGNVNNSGYGYMKYENKKSGVHRISYKIFYGEFDYSKFVLHECDNPRCINPRHLFLGTQSDNMKDCFLKGRLKKAYKWTKENNPNTGQPMSAEKKAAMSKRKQKPFKIIDPRGNLIEGINLTQFCKTNNLNQGRMWSVIMGKARANSHKGYTRYISN